MFFIDVISIFSKVTVVQYVFGAFGVLGVSLLVRRLVLNK
jgi:hypothetical protein